MPTTLLVADDDPAIRTLLRDFFEAQGYAVALAVADTGAGIPAGVLPTVFERSVRVDAARAGGGAGLGLSIVRALAEAMGGAAAIESRDGAGTTVTLRLPVAERG